MYIGRARFVRAAVADDGLDHDDRRAPGFLLGGADRSFDGVQVVSVRDALDVPAVCLKALGDVFGESDLRVTLNGNVVVVVQANQLAEFEMPGQGCGFGGDAFHQVAVAHDRISVVIDHGRAVPVQAGGQVRFGNRHAHAVGEALPQWTGCRLDAGGQAVFRVAGSQAAPLAELLELFERQIIPGQVQQ